MKLSRLGSATLPDVFEATRVDANPESARALRVTLDAFAERSCRTLSNEKENSVIDLTYGNVAKTRKVLKHVSTFILGHDGVRLWDRARESRTMDSCSARKIVTSPRAVQRGQSGRATSREV